jgi:hypothetical protein
MEHRFKTKMPGADPSQGFRFRLRDVPEEKNFNKISILEHDPEKWNPVFGKDHAKTEKSDQ